MITDEADRQKIFNLYFYHMYSYAKLERYFKGKYNYSEFKTVIFQQIDGYVAPKKKKRNGENNKTALVERYLKKHSNITKQKALEKYGVENLSPIIDSLRKRGYKISFVNKVYELQEEKI